MIALQSRRTTTSTGSTDVYERRLIVGDGSVSWMHQMHRMQHLQQFSKDELSEMIRTWIPASISMMKPNLFSALRHFHSISFESNSRLTRIESSAFSGSSLQSIMIPWLFKLLVLHVFHFVNHFH
jgi:hypothetical protein